ncbi:hypothetical protein [Pelagibius sp. Alg239-R121]|uniref:hypothetical protein n=1 Tax=Pelagibius sp. Alg239-R121 TaxID=2993448 RepID=UPI0024A67943|nr:hypothetical protein [Pelagibius sp. Alg239-R121]
MRKVLVLRLCSMAALFVLSACVTGHKVDVPPTYNFGTTAPDQPPEGIVAFSLQINIDDLPCSSDLDFGFAVCRSGIYILRRDAQTEDGRDGLAAVNPFQVDATPEGLYGPASYIAGPLQPRKDMVIWKLPEGKYTIWQWYVSSGNSTLSPKDYPELYDFEVTAGKATYLGRLSLTLDVTDRDNLTFISKISDQSDSELPKLLEAFPQFRDATETNLLRRIPLN